MSTPVFPPPHPFPPPQPQEPSAPHVHAPMVYVYERQQWEYKISTSEMTDETLNTLGAEGWELVGVVALPAITQFYFKRPRA
jgi:hypothetical protein